MDTRFMPSSISRIWLIQRHLAKITTSLISATSIHTCPSLSKKKKVPSNITIKDDKEKTELFPVPQRYIRLFPLLSSGL